MKDKCGKKLSKKDIKVFFEEYGVFCVAIVVSIVFIFSPIILKFNVASRIISDYLEPLKSTGYKSTYVETVGALVGTFLAITGALWTQQRAEKRKEKLEIREVATIVYYDFKFAFDDMLTLLSEFEKEKREYESKGMRYSDTQVYNSLNANVVITLNENWIQNVAKLRMVLSNNELKLIYKLYSDFKLCISYFENNNALIDKIGFGALYNFALENICMLDTSNGVEFLKYEKHEKVMCKLEKIMDGVCRCVR